MLRHSLVLMFALLLGGTSYVVNGEETEASPPPISPVENLFHSVQFTLAGLHAKGGLTAAVLSRRASSIAELAGKILSDEGVTVTEQDIEDMITIEGSKFNDLASLTALFDDQISLDAAKLDVAFLLWDKLSKIIVDEASSDEKVNVAIAAIKKTSLAMVDTLEDLTDIFHYLNGPTATPSDVNVRRRRKTTVSGHIEHSSHGGTSGGVSVSHSWRRRRETTVSGHVEHSSGSGTSGGVSVSHSWRKRSGTAPTHHGNTGSVDSHRSSSIGIGTNPTFGKRGKTTVSGHVSHSSHGGTSGGVSVSHSWRKRNDI